MAPVNSQISSNLFWSYGICHRWRSDNLKLAVWQLFFIYCFIQFILLKTEAGAASFNESFTACIVERERDMPTYLDNIQEKGVVLKY